MYSLWGSPLSGKYNYIDPYGVDSSDLFNVEMSWMFMAHFLAHCFGHQDYPDCILKVMMSFKVWFVLLGLVA